MGVLPLTIKGFVDTVYTAMESLFWNAVSEAGSSKPSKASSSNPRETLKSAASAAEMKIATSSSESTLAGELEVKESSLKSILEANEQWSETMKETVSNDYFVSLSKGQQPKILWIGCSDSRVPPTDITRLGSGDIFVHRNVGNCYYGDDSNSNSVIEYAIGVLQVKHVIICGHYSCGAVAASLHPTTTLPYDHLRSWLIQIKETVSQHKRRLDDIGDPTKQLNVISELNAIANAAKIASSPSIQQAWAGGISVQLHAWIYQIEVGRLVDLGLDLRIDSRDINQAAQNAMERVFERAG